MQNGEHRLLEVFATAEGERDYVARVQSLISSGSFDVVEALLRADLEALDTDLARRCVAMNQYSVSLSGWEELKDAIAQFEGDQITAVAIGMANEPDMTFSPDGIHNPYLTLGIYTDERYAFSNASPDMILGECARENPAWAGTEEDIEVYLELEGLGPLNTALLRHKTQFFFRDDPDGAPVAPPLSYLEFTLAGWWRALLFHRTIKTMLDSFGIPGNVPVIAGIANMRQEVAAVHLSAITVATTAASVSELRIRPKMKKLDAIVDLTGTSIRHRIAEDEAAEAAEQTVEKPIARSSLLRRLFGRGV